MAFSSGQAETGSTSEELEPLIPDNVDIDITGGTVRLYTVLYWNSRRSCVILAPQCFTTDSSTLNAESNAL